MFVLDLWYNNTPHEIDKIDILFYPNRGEYRGNVYSSGKIIGDYVCTDSVLLEKRFYWLKFNYD